MKKINEEYERLKAKSRLNKTERKDWIDLINFREILSDVNLSIGASINDLLRISERLTAAKKIIPGAARVSETKICENLEDLTRTEKKLESANTVLSGMNSEYWDSGTLMLRDLRHELDDIKNVLRSLEKSVEEIRKHSSDSSEDAYEEFLSLREKMFEESSLFKYMSYDLRKEITMPLLKKDLGKIQEIFSKLDPGINIHVEIRSSHPVEYRVTASYK